MHNVTNCERTTPLKVDVDISHVLFPFYLTPP